MSSVRRFMQHPVAQNAMALYAVQVAGYVFPLVTLPYLARILRPEGFGLLLFAQSFALGASLTIEYGFNLSATREVARNRGSIDEISETAAGVLGAKMILLVVFAVVAGAAAWSAANFRQHPIFLIWAIVQTLAFGLSPFWYFQGTERMLRSVLVDFIARTAGVGGIFLLVRTSGDGWKALALIAAAGCASTLIQTIWMYREIEFRRPKWKSSVLSLRAGWHMFLFRAADNIYGSANAFILGLFVSPVEVGYYGGAERIFKALYGMTVPLTQAVYPHMSRLASHDSVKASRLARRTLSLVAVIGIAMGLVVALLARRTVPIFLGHGYEPSISVLCIFAIVLPITIVNSAVIMHWMLPMGLDRAASAVTVGALMVNLVAAAVLAPRFAHVGMAWAILIAESLRLVALIVILIWRGLTPMTISRRPEAESAEIP